MSGKNTLMDFGYTLLRVKMGGVEGKSERLYRE